MNDSITLGRVFGIQVGINWSWLAIFALFVWSLATRIFPDANPGLSDNTYWAMAVVAALLFFLSIILHEFGHALVARREGVEIDGITLWLFGGVARFRSNFPSAGAEFRIAIAGPLVTLVLGFVFAAAALKGNLPDTAATVAGWLGGINLFLLVFNLLPALPLDGGRVLRSALWRWRGDFGSATHTAALVGRGFGVLMIAGGVGLALYTRQVTELFLALMGWFIFEAAGAEDRYGQARRVLRGVSVGDVMTADPLTVPADATLMEFAAGVVQNGKHTAYPVVENGRPVGLLPLRCLAESPQPEWPARRVRDCMVGIDRVAVFAPGEELVTAAADLTEETLRRGLVLDGDRLVGLLSISDVARVFDERGRAA